MVSDVSATFVENDHSSGVTRVEDTLLLSACEPTEHGEDFNPGKASAREEIAGLADVALSRHEEEDIAMVRFVEQVDDSLHSAVDVGQLFLLAKDFVQRPVTHLNRKETARDFDDGGTLESAGELVRVNGGGGDDDFEIRTAIAELAQVTEQVVDIERTLVGLVDDDGVVLIQRRVAANLGEEHAVRRHFHECVGRGAIAKANPATDLLSPDHAQFISEPAGQSGCRHPARLCAHDLRRQSAAGLKAHLGDLSRLTATRFAGDDDDRVLFDGAANLISPGADRQIVGIGDCRQSRGTALAQSTGSLRLCQQLAEVTRRRAFAAATAAAAPGVAHASLEPLAVDEHTTRQQRFELSRGVHGRGGRRWFRESGSCGPPIPPYSDSARDRAARP